MKLFTVKEASVILGCSVTKIHKLMHSGVLKNYSFVKNRFMISKMQVNRLLSKQRHFSSKHDLIRIVLGEYQPYDEIGLCQALCSLTPREEFVLRVRFSFNCDGMTLQETGNKLGVSRERIRQIEAKALRKMRHPSRMKMFQLTMEIS